MQRQIEKECTVNAPRSDVWRAFTTSAGARTFFAPDANIELRLAGPYEIYFLSDAEPGLKGSEGCIVLSFIPEEMLSFTWSTPPTFPDIREQRTFVVLQFHEVDEARTRVRLTHAGWGDGEQWDKVFDYFLDAWDVVLDSLKERFVSGPLF